jgi:hypothetical protein
MSRRLLNAEARRRGELERQSRKNRLVMWKTLAPNSRRRQAEDPQELIFFVVADGFFRKITVALRFQKSIAKTNVALENIAVIQIGDDGWHRHLCSLGPVRGFFQPPMGHGFAPMGSNARTFGRLSCSPPEDTGDFIQFPLVASRLRPERV